MIAGLPPLPISLAALAGLMALAARLWVWRRERRAELEARQAAAERAVLSWLTIACWVLVERAVAAVIKPPRRALPPGPTATTTAVAS